MLEDRGIKSLTGGGNSFFENIPNILFIPIIGPLLLDNNKIQIENNNNLINDLLLFIINNFLTVLELYCIIDILINYETITTETIFVSFIILITRIYASINIYRNKNKNTIDENIKINEETQSMNNFKMLFIIGIPLYIILLNIEKYTMNDNIILSLIISIVLLPYLRLIYNYINKDNFNENTAFWLNVTEKILCGLIIFVVIKNNYEINDILNFIKNINNETENNNINNNTNSVKNETKQIDDTGIDDKQKKENILLQNFNSLFSK